MHSELRGQRDSTTEPEQRVQKIEDQREERVDDEGVFNGDGYEVYEREEGEDRAEETVVDDRRAGAACDHVARDREDEQSPEELCRVLGETD